MCGWVGGWWVDIIRWREIAQNSSWETNPELDSHVPHPPPPSLAWCAMKRKLFRFEEGPNVQHALAQVRSISPQTRTCAACVPPIAFLFRFLSEQRPNFGWRSIWRCNPLHTCRQIVRSISEITAILWVFAFAYFIANWTWYSTTISDLAAPRAPQLAFCFRFENKLAACCNFRNGSSKNRSNTLGVQKNYDTTATTSTLTSRTLAFTHSKNRRLHSLNLKIWDSIEQILFEKIWDKRSGYQRQCSLAAPHPGWGWWHLSMSEDMSDFAELKEWNLKSPSSYLLTDGNPVKTRENIVKTCSNREIFSKVLFAEFFRCTYLEKVSPFSCFMRRTV